MTNPWLVEAKKRLLPLSRDQDNFENAIKEWTWTNEVYDLYPNRDFEEDYDEDPLTIDGVEYSNGYANCGFCGRERLRYVYLIKNRLTDNFLYVGSKCIEKFDIASQKGNLGKERDVELKKKFSETKNVAKQKHVIDSLISLIDDFNEEKILGFIEYYKTNGAFTPMQMLVIAKLLSRKRIKYNSQFFKIKLRRNREKEQLSQINSNEIIKYLYPVMSKSQIKLANEYLDN